MEVLCIPGSPTCVVAGVVEEGGIHSVEEGIAVVEDSMKVGIPGAVVQLYPRTPAGSICQRFLARGPTVTAIVRKVTGLVCLRLVARTAKH